MAIDDADIITSTTYAIAAISGGAAIDPADWADHENRIAALEDIALPAQGAISTGRYYGPMSTLAGGTDTGRVDRIQLANRLHAAPFLCLNDASFDQLGVQVSIAAAAGSTVRLGIYSAGADGLPDALLADEGTVSIATTGFRFVSIAETLGRGLYWLAAVSSVDMTVRANTADSLTAFGGHVSTDGTQPIVSVYRYEYLAAGAALPATFTSGGGHIYADAGVPFYWLRAT